MPGVCRPVARPDPPTVLFAHGNTGNLSARLGTLRQHTDMGHAVLAFDYRGFGRSCPVRKNIIAILSTSPDLLVIAIPIDANAGSEVAARAGGLALDYVLEELGRRNQGVSIAVLDACRNNPFAGTTRGTRGLARVSAASGMLVAYATEPGNVARDGDGDNGVYTLAWLEALSEANLDEDALLKRVGAVVEQRTNRQQRPWREGSLRGDFIFNAPVSVTVQHVTPTPTAGLDQETVFWKSVERSDDADEYELFLQQFPDGRYAQLAQFRIAKLLKTVQANKWT
jgi:hypothetical protein